MQGTQARAEPQQLRDQRTLTHMHHDTHGSLFSHTNMSYAVLCQHNILAHHPLSV